MTLVPTSVVQLTSKEVLGLFLLKIVLVAVSLKFRFTDLG